MTSRLKVSAYQETTNISGPTWDFDYSAATATGQPLLALTAPRNGARIARSEPLFTMATSPVNPTPPGWFPAWVVSFAFHLSAVVLLVMAIERAPRGGTDRMGDTIDLVLNHTAATGDSLVGETRSAIPAIEVAQAAPPPPAPTIATPPAEPRIA